MKILFLDHHGVMRITPHPNPGILVDFDKNCVRILNEILESDDIQIVVSSDWKYWVSLEKMQEFYKEQGIIKSPIDYTVKTIYDYNNYAEQRANEIKLWLDTHDVLTWAAVDDIDMRPYLTNFVWISEPSLGLQQSMKKEELLLTLQSIS